MARVDLHKVRGIVLPEKWDNNDHLVSVMIYTPDDDEYVVKSDSMGKELFSMVDENVEVVGTIKEQNDGQKIITVKNYKYIGSGEDEYEYEDDEGGYGDEEEW